MQQSPAIGRVVSAWMAYGQYRTLGRTPLGYQRIVENRPFVEMAII